MTLTNYHIEYENEPAQYYTRAFQSDDDARAWAMRNPEVITILRITEYAEDYEECITIYQATDID